jgi:hypothetical protein
MDFVNQINFATTLGWSVLDVIENLPRIINSSPGRSIDLKQVNKSSFIHTLAG